jgi:hypothetical protein
LCLGAARCECRIKRQGDDQSRTRHLSDSTGSRPCEDRSTPSSSAMPKSSPATAAA